jgi:hypothetical protein
LVNAGFQFRADEVVQGQTVGVDRSGQPHNIVTQPASEHGDVVGHRDRLVLLFGGVAEWRDLILFYEYFHGDNGAGLGASHQTGWTGIVARLMHLFATVTPEHLLMVGLTSRIAEMAEMADAVR